MTAIPLHLVVIGAAEKGPDPRYPDITASIPTVASHLPTPENLLDGIKMATDCGYTLHVYFVDSVFEYRTLPADAKKIAAYPQNVVTVSSLAPDEFDFQNVLDLIPQGEDRYKTFASLTPLPPLIVPPVIGTTTTDAIKNLDLAATTNTLVPVIAAPVGIRSTLDPVVVISYTDDASTYDVMSSFGSFNTVNRFFVVNNEKSIPLSVNTIVAEAANRIIKAPLNDDLSYVYIPFTVYDLVSGNLVPKGIADYDGQAILKHMTLLAELIPQYIKGGFLEDKFVINALGKSWYMNVETLILAAFFDEYQPVMQARDKDIQLTLLTNAQFRKNVTIYLIGVLSNFAVNNSIITPEQIVMLGGYTTPEFYSAVIENMKDLTVPFVTSHSLLN
jgi:hypothetical protein